MMKKVLLCASLILFLQVIFLFVFKDDLHAYTKCYVGGVLIGDMHTWDRAYGYPFLVKGGWGTVEFAAYKGIVAKNEVQFRPGGGAWTRYSFLQIQSTRDRYFLDFAVPNDDKCGPWWTNTMFRYLLDGQNHYCNDRTVKYKEGWDYDLFIPNKCLEKKGLCTMPGVNEYTQQAGFDNGYEILLNKASGAACKDYEFCLDNGISTNCGVFSENGGIECRIKSSRFSWPVSGKLVGFLRYTVADPTIISASAYVRLFDKINDNYCGGALVDSSPTPTPTPTTAVVPTPTPTCAPVAPDQPILSSPADGSRFFSGSVTMKWRALDSWGKGCPTNDNRFKVYLTTNWSYASDGDLSNNGLAAICEVDSSTLQCARTGL